MTSRIRLGLKTSTRSIFYHSAHSDSLRTLTVVSSPLAFSLSHTSYSCSPTLPSRSSPLTTLPPHNISTSDLPASKPLQVPSVLSPASSSVSLRSYQQSAIDACLSAFKSGRRRIGVSSPTGSGKTTMFMHLIPLVPSILDFANINSEGGDDKPRKTSTSGRTLILVGSVELANQAERAAKSILGEDYTIQVEQSKRVASGLADVTIATYQTLNNIDRLEKFDPSQFKLVIVDEAHHAAAPSYLRLLHYFNDDVQLPRSLEPFSSSQHGNKVPIVGFSATFSRHDQLALSSVFEEIVFHRDLKTMLSEGWLAPAKSTSVYCDLDLDRIELNQQGDYNTSSLAQHVNTPETNNLIVRTYLHRAGDRRSTLIFCVDLTHVDNLVTAFRNAGIDARSVSSLSHKLTRKRTIESFGQGEFPVLINCEVLTEGTDIPQIDCIILARPTQSKNLLMQMVGRGLRMSPETGKNHCYIIDIVDNMSKSSGMAVVPTLLGLSHDEMMSENNVCDEHGDKHTDGEIVKPHSTSTRASDYNVTYLDSSDPFRVASPSVEGKTLVQLSQNAWVACGKHRFVLELMSSGFIMVNQVEDGTWTIGWTMKLPAEIRKRSPFATKRVVGSAETLERALQAADQFAERRLGRELVKQYAAWRHRPATEKQVALLLKLKHTSSMQGKAMSEMMGDEKRIIVVGGKEILVDELKSGQVASYLCAAQHGALTLRDKADRARRKEEAKVLVKKEKEKLAAERNLALPPSF